MHRQPSSLGAFAIVAGIAVLAFSGWAGADPPSRVARLGYMTGAVSFSPAGEIDWVQAGINRPLTTGDRLWVDAGARAEIQVGGAMIRMSGGTGLSVLNLDDLIAQLQLTQGTLNVRVRRLEPGQVFEVDTPNLAFTLRQPGEYRIEVDPDGNATTIVVRKGQGEVYGEGAAYVIDSRQPYRFSGTGLREYRYVDAPRFDEFDRWSSDRDRSYENSISARYVSPDVVGYQDLDANGTWRADATYGNVWYPESRGGRLGALPRRTLGMGRPLGLDLGGRRALGLRRVPLRPLDESSRNVGVGARSGAQSGLLRPGAGRVRRRQQLPDRDLQWQRRWRRMVPACAARSLSTVLCGEPPLFREREPQQHGHQQHGHQQLLQQHERDQRRLRQPAGAGCRRRRADDCLRAVAAGREGRGARIAGDGCRRAGGSRPGHRTDREERPRGRRPGRKAAFPRIRASRRRPHCAPCRARRIRCSTAATCRKAGPAAG